LGVELLVRLAARNADPPCTTETLARSIRRSLSYTEQLIAQLREAGLVKTKHGPGGGYYLTRPTDRITVADVFRVFDEPRTLDGRAFAPQALTQPEIAELFGADLL
jgi:Rrf2 family protein